MRDDVVRRAEADDDAVVRQLWDGPAVRRLARDLSQIAAGALLRTTGPVRPPGSARTASRIVERRRGRSDVASIVKEVERATLHLSHPRYISQQVAAPIPAAALVESVVAAMNQSLAVWEMSPIATAIDRDLMARFKNLFGYPRRSEGSLVPGGAFANLTALLAARSALAPQSWRKGARSIALIAGEQTHYSMSRAAGLLGLGTDAVFRVPLDREFCTDAERADAAFAAARKRGFRRFILVASSGSTPTGSFDDLVAMRRLATAHGAWLHVDAAHGAGLAFSDRLRARLRGLHRADSVTFDPHKMMFMPLSAGGVLVRDGAHLTSPLAERAPYLFGARRRWPDIGQFTLACSQRFEALKIWIVWRAYGPHVWDALAARTCAVARAAYEYCSASDVLEPVHEPHSNILCFRLRRLARREASDSRHWAVKEALNESGFGYLSSAVVDGRRALRMVVMNPRTTATDVRQVLQRVERLSR